MKRITKRLQALCAILLVAALLSACGMSGKFQSEVKDGDYEDALEIYESVIAGNDERESDALEFLLEYLQETLDSYVAGEIEEADFETMYRTLSYLDNSLGIITDSLAAAYQTYSTVSTSRSSYEAGVQYLEDGNYEEAITSFSQVTAADSADYSDAQEKLQQAQEQYITQIVATANEYINNGDYTTAISLLKDAQSVVGETSEFTTLLETAYTKNAESTIADYIAQGEYVKAFEAYESAKSNSYVTISSDLTTSVESAKSAYRTQLVEQANAKSDGGDVSGALALLEEGLEVLDGDETLTSAAESIESAYRTKMLDQAASAYSSSGIDAAVTVLTEALGVLSGDETLNDEISYYRTLSPVKLSSLTAFETDGTFSTATETTDCFGTTHTDIIYCYGTVSETYRIDGSYSSLSGTFFLSSTTTDDKGSVTFYGDGAELATYTATGASDPVTFTVNLTGVKDLKVVITRISGYGKRYLSECELTPVASH